MEIYGMDIVALLQVLPPHLVQKRSRACRTYVYAKITSESQKRIPSIVVIHYCAWYPFLRLRRYVGIDYRYKYYIKEKWHGEVFQVRIMPISLT